MELILITDNRELVDVLAVSDPTSGQAEKPTFDQSARGRCLSRVGATRRARAPDHDAAIADGAPWLKINVSWRACGRRLAADLRRVRLEQPVHQLLDEFPQPRAER